MRQFLVEILYYLLSPASSLILYFISILFSPDCHVQTSNIGMTRNSMGLQIRPALASDLDALTWIGLAAFPFEPQWPYRYPFAADFPEDHEKFTWIRYSEWLDAASTPDCIIMVAESPSLEDQNVTKVVGLSIWRIPRR